jgi:hypothetical protein
LADHTRHQPTSSNTAQSSFLLESRCVSNLPLCLSTARSATKRYASGTNTWTRKKMEHIPPNVERWWGLAAGSFHLAPLSPLAMIKQKRDENRGTGCLEWAIFLCQLRSITSISERQTLSSFKREFVEVSIAGRDENPPAGHNGWTAAQGVLGCVF